MSASDFYDAKEMSLTTTKTQAAKLLSAAEMAVFSTSLSPAIKELSAARLVGKVKRSRTMRDKFRDLLKRQKVATRARTGTKVGQSGHANERTAQKAEIFDEVLQRFTARLEQVQAAAARETARQEAAMAKAKARADKAAAAVAKKATAKRPVAKKAVVKKAVLNKAVVKKAVAKKAAAEGVQARPARSDKAPATAPGAAGGGVGPGSKRAKVAAKDARLAASLTRPIQAHISSAGRRQQAKRDRRG